MKTKKMQVSLTFKDFKAKSEEFVIPFTGNEKKGFRGLNSGNASKYGMITFVGREISTNDVFAKLVDSGQKIDDVDATLSIISQYLEELQQFKVGNVISVSYTDNLAFKLIKEANKPTKKNEKKGRLP
ncbi:MAG: hypothetical protein CSB34_02585 [Desulfobulbus propionicus]|nr:MAG: hypothetical protein CSB34_02585 [Desulfobulbus propionicus]